MRIEKSCLSVFLGVFLLLVVSATQAQEHIRFTENTFDFGEVKEEDGPIRHTFSMVNVGGAPVAINGVEVSCGCTTPEWTQEAILPGDTGIITAQFDPENRPGKFNKSLQVSYSIDGMQGSAETLYIEGIVRPKPKTVEDDLPTKMGMLRLKYKSLNLGKVTNEQVISRSYSVYNDGDSAISWQTELSELPPNIAIAFEPELLEPKSFGEIKLEYDPKEGLGFVSSGIRLYTNEPMDSVKDLSVIATIEEYFPPMTAEELARAPKLRFDRTQHDYGRVNAGTTVVTEFTLTNYGQTAMNIRAAKSNCGCTIAKLQKDDLAPGETTQMEVSFDTSGRRGRQYKTVTVFSNDPTAPTQMVSLKADIAE